MREESKATTKPWFSRLLRHPARKRGGSILATHKTHTYTYVYFFIFYILTFPGPTRLIVIEAQYKLKSKFHYIYLAQNLLKTRFSTRSPTCFEQVADMSQTR